ncbi:MAG TPA: universal stress protein [Rhodocyclaceae bacterium]|nr:universal stress protein [Rhodocyclaceae bacterium]
MYKQILSPVDGSPTSNRGVIEAIRLAKDQSAELRFLHVADAHLGTIDMSGAVNMGAVLDILRQAGAEILAAAKALAVEEGIAAETVMVDSMIGRIGEEVVRQAKAWPADLIVMGTHGRRGVSHLFMGSDAETVIRTSPVPILLVRYAQDESKLVQG